MNGRYIWLSSPEQAAMVNAALWLSLALSLVWMLIQSVRRWRWERKQEHRIRAAAGAQARYLVFTSFVKAGGWATDLQQTMFDQLVQEGMDAAAKHGIDYHSELCEQVEVATIELDNVLYNFMKQVQKDEAESPQSVHVPAEDNGMGRESGAGHTPADQSGPDIFKS